LLAVVVPACARPNTDAQAARQCAAWSVRVTNPTPRPQDLFVDGEFRETVPPMARTASKAFVLRQRAEPEVGFRVTPGGGTTLAPSVRVRCAEYERAP
jgi:hypothetical protein